MPVMLGETFKENTFIKENFYTRLLTDKCSNSLGKMQESKCAAAALG